MLPLDEPLQLFSSLQHIQQLIVVKKVNHGMLRKKGQEKNI